MLGDSIIRGLVGPLQGNAKHFLDWRLENWHSLPDDPQVVEDTTLLLGLMA